jgi:hypothetical protein
MNTKSCRYTEEESKIMARWNYFHARRALAYLELRLAWKFLKTALKHYKASLHE